MSNTDKVDEIRKRIHARNRSFRIETGRDLIAAKALLDHGKFGDWLKTNFNWSESTAQNYMNAAKLVDKSPEIGVLAPSAVIALAASNTPETVRADVIADLADGKVPTPKEIKAKIADVKSQSVAAKMNCASAAVVKLPVNKVANKPIVPAQQDLVKLLRAAGQQVASAAFQVAYPNVTVIDDDEFKAELAKPEAA